KVVSVAGISISGTDAGNYTFNTAALTTADITARPLTISATGVNKVYDGSPNATVTLSDNRVSGDMFTGSYTGASFTDPNVANGKTVNVGGISISGTDAGNYASNNMASTTANITQAIPILPGLQTSSSTYGVSTTLSVTVSAVMGGATPTGTITFTFSY